MSTIAMQKPVAPGIYIDRDGKRWAAEELALDRDRWIEKYNQLNDQAIRMVHSYRRSTDFQPIY